MRKFIFLSISFILFACSKDDNASPPDQTNGTMQGVFIDSPVEGIKYETETHSGFTDENGTYEYEEGETVTFYVGDIELGSALATGELSPIDIASTPNSDIETLEVQNIAAFLQTLDEDGNPENGIYLDMEIVEAISFTEIDFTKNIIQILGEIALEVFENTGSSLEVVFPEIATVHLAETLGIEFEPQASLTLNFLPTFTNFFTKNIAVNWVHEFNDSGRLIKSSKYEKYPSRILGEYTFTDNNPDDLIMKVESKEYQYTNYPFHFNSTYEFKFNEQYFLKEQIFKNEFNGAVSKYFFDEINDRGWVESIDYLLISPDGNEIRNSSAYVYNESGFMTDQFHYNESGDLILKSKITSTDFGDIDTQVKESRHGIIVEKEFYTEDHTRERTEITRDLVLHSNSEIYEYDEIEVLVKKVTTIHDSNNHKKTVTYYNEGYLDHSEEYREEILSLVSYYEFNGVNDIVRKREHYDSNGILYATHYFDDQGNLIDIVYA